MYCPVGQGTRGRIVEFGGLRLTESLHAPDGRLDWHAHQNGCMTLLLDGRMQESFSSQELDCRHGELLVKPPEERHRTRFGPEGARCLIIEVVDSEEDSLRACSSLFGRIEHGSANLGLTQRITAELAMGDVASDLLLEGIALELVGVAMRSSPARGPIGRPPAWLADVHDRVRAEYRGRVSVAALAATAGVHPDHLGRSFRRQYGHTIGDLVRDLRLTWAAEQLQRPDRGLTAISIEAGFCDQSHFSRAFRRRFGVPPGRFRAGR